MKALRLMAILAVLAVSTFSFKKAAESFQPTFAAWFLIPGGNPDNPADYRTSPQGFTCNGLDIVCSIQDNDTDQDGAPDFTHGNVTDNLAAYSATFRPE